MRPSDKTDLPPGIKIINTLSARGGKVRHTPYGSVVTCHKSREIEVVCVTKEAEQIDPEWYSQPSTDHILVLKGQLKIEFPGRQPLILRPGELMILPKGRRCRAYSHPRRKGSVTIFLAFYRPAPSDNRNQQ